MSVTPRSAMPKAVPVGFEVDGVQCTRNKDGLVNVGLNAGWPSKLRFLTKVKLTDDLDASRGKVRAHAKFGALLAYSSGDGPKIDGESSDATPSQPIGVREIESLRELTAAADGPAQQFGWQLQQQQAERAARQVADVERDKRRVIQLVARAVKREAQQAYELDRLRSLVQQPWELLHEKQRHEGERLRLERERLEGQLRIQREDASGSCVPPTASSSTCPDATSCKNYVCRHTRKPYPGQPVDLSCSICPDVNPRDCSRQCDRCSSEERPVTICAVDGCNVRLCHAIDCKLRAQCPHDWEFEDFVHAQAAAGLCKCECCEELATLFMCTREDQPCGGSWMPYADASCTHRQQHILSLLYEHGASTVQWEKVDCDWLLGMTEENLAKTDACLAALPEEDVQFWRGAKTDEEWLKLSADAREEHRQKCLEEILYRKYKHGVDSM